MSEVVEPVTDRIEVVAATTTSQDVSEETRANLRQRSAIEPLEVDNETQNISESEPEYPTGAKFYLICLAISFVLLLGGLDGNIVATAVPAITDHFHTVADVGWYYSAYKLTSCAFQFMFGKLYKLFSIKRVFMISIVIFLIGSILCTAAATSRMFVLGRAVTGLGAGGIVSGCFNLLVLICPLRQRPIVTGVLGAVETISIVAAPILGGVLTQELSWRACFWINLPLGGAALVSIFFFLSDPRKTNNVNRTWRDTLSQLDLIGNLVFLPSLTCLFMALSWAGTKYPWNDPIIVALLVVFAILLGVFVVDQYVKQDAATLPPRIIKNRNVLAGAVFIICLNSGVTVVEYYMPTYFQAIRGYSPARSGYMMLPLLIGTFIGMLIQGGGSTIIGYYTPFAIFASILAPIGVGLMTTWTLQTDLAKLIMYSAMVGFAIGIGFQTSQLAVQTALSPSDAPLGLGVIVFAQGFGPALFVSIAQTIFSNRLATNLHHLAPHLNVSSIENMGLSELKASVGPENLDKVLLGFHDSLSETWYLPVALCSFTLVGSLALEWRSVKQKNN